MGKEIRRYANTDNNGFKGFFRLFFFGGVDFPEWVLESQGRFITARKLEELQNSEKDYSRMKCWEYHI